MLCHLFHPKRRFSQGQLERYFREGYLLVPALVPEPEIDLALAAYPEPPAPGQGWSASVFDHENLLRDASRHRLLVEPRHRLLVEPHIVGAARQIFEAKPRIYYGMTAVVPAHGGSGLPWHQDNQYDQILFSALNIFVALCDIFPTKRSCRSRRERTAPERKPPKKPKAWAATAKRPPRQQTVFPSRA